MEKTATLNIRVNPDTKKRAEDVLSMLGIPMSTAIDMYLRQIGMTGSIPFPVTVPNFPKEINMGCMNAEELHQKFEKGYKDAVTGNVTDARQAFAEFRKAEK